VTTEPTGLDPAEQRVFAGLTALLAEVTGEDERWAAQVTPASRLEGDLRLESIDLAALGELLRSAYGDRVDVAAFVAGLDIDQIIGLTAGDLAVYVAASGAAPSAAETPR
jgi:acyl carrier protein